MPANRVKGPVIRKEIRIEARPETVFRLLTDQAQIVRWKGQKATINPTPGGEYRIVFNEQDVVVGKVVEIDPPRRFVFTWGWEGAGSPVPPGSSTVEITLTPSGRGTLLSLVHTGLPAPAIDIHTKGWELYTHRLSVVATGGDPGPDPNAKAGGM